MADSKIMALLEALLRATEKRQVAWEIATSENAFRARIGDGGIRIERRAPARNQTHHIEGNPEAFSVWIVNSENQVLDAFDFEPLQPGHSLLTKLFPLVRKTALKTDQVVDSMLATLESAG